MHNQQNNSDAYWVFYKLINKHYSLQYWLFSFYFTLSGGASYRQGRVYRPYHFRSGPTSGPTTQPGRQKVKQVSTKIFSMFDHMTNIAYEYKYAFYELYRIASQE